MLLTRSHFVVGRLPRSFPWTALLCALFCALLGSPVFAATQTVSSTGDDAADATTLRGALAAASPGDTIAFSLPPSSVITLSQGELLISQDVTITGPGAALLTVSGGNTDRVFHVTAGSVTLSGLTVSGGSDPTFSGAGFFQEGGTLTLTSCTVSGNTGGGIGQTAGTLDMTGCAVSGNTAIGQAGAGLGISGSASLTNCTITNNTADQGAGVGVYNGVATLTNCVVSGNTAGTQKFSGGGGVANYSGTLTVTGCTLSGNTANYGAGLYTNGGTTTATDCTLSGNTAAGPIASGGGTENDKNGTLSLTSCTVSGNTATYGSGLFNNAATTITSTIIAGNITSDIGLGSGQVTSGGSNLIGTANMTLTGAHDINGVADPKLGPLQDNGGPTPTQALLSGSPAIDADYNTGTTTDQRGVVRPQGARNDIGAYEALIVTNTDDSGPGSLRNAVASADAVATTSTNPGATILFDPTVFATPQTITLSGGEIAVTGSLTIQGPGASLLTVSGNSANRIFNVSAGTVGISGLTATAGLASGGNGGAIFGDTGTTLSLTQCVVTNSSANTGGGVYSSGTLSLTDCTVSGNQASSEAGGVGIYNGLALTMTGCTLTGNTAVSYGGGLGVSGSSIVATVTNCTLTGNQSDNGGGIDKYSNAQLTLVSCTITGNTGASISGLDEEDSAGDSLQATIVANNSGGPNISGTCTSLGSNLIGDTDGNGFTGGTNNDQTGVADPMLGPLQDNGGPTQTLAVLPGSPALDADYTNGTTTDQRGIARPQGARNDIGAFEYQEPVAGDDAYTTSQGVALTVGAPGVLANDTDPYGYPLTPTVVTGPGSGTVTLKADGSFSYTAPVGFYGTDSFTYQDTDDHGNTSRVATVTITVVQDTTPPVTTASLAGTAGTNGYYTGPVSVTLSATDDASGVASTVYTIDGGATQTYTAPFTVSGDGSHTVTFSSTDRAGNAETAKSTAFKIDATPPTLTFGAPTPAANANGYNNGTVTVSYTAADATSGLATASSGTLTFSASGAGQTQTVTATDSAGNSRRLTSPAVSIDLVKPVTTAATQSTTTGEQVTLSATDDLSGVASTVYSLDGGPTQTYTAPFVVSGNGPHTVAFHSTDKADNVEAQKTAQFTTNVAAPITTAALSGPQGTNGWYTGAVTVTLTAQSKGLPVARTFYTVDGGPTQTYTGPFAISGDKVHTLTYDSVDTAGNQEAVNQKSVKIDGTAPVTTATLAGPRASSGAFTGTATVTLTATDNLSGVANTVYSVDGGPTQTYTGPFTISTAGPHTVTFHSVDVAGNAEAAKTATLTLQLTPAAPAVAHTFPAGLQMFSVPADYSGVPLGTALSQTNPRLAVWVPSLVQYVLTPTAPADALRPGQGYWARLGGETSLYDLGTPTPTGKPFAIALGKGWNMIGDPFPATVGLSGVSVTAGGKTYTGFSAANAAGLVAYTLYTFPAGSTAYQTEDGGGTLTPYSGYWVYAFQSCTLQVSAP